MAQLLHARLVNRVVNRRAAARARLGDLVAQCSRIAGEGLHDLRLVVESHHKCFIFIAAQHAEQKIDRSVLLELDAVADAIGGIQQHADAQRQIGLLAEVTDFLRELVVPDFEVAPFEFGDKFVAAVQHGEEHIDEVDDRLDRLIALLRRILLWRGSLRRCGCLGLCIRRGCLGLVRRRLLRTVGQWK